MAHRGDSARVPENTMLALESAVDIGVDFIETDMRLTKDDIPVLFHDDSLTRITGVEGAVRDKTLDELLDIDLGHYFSPDGGETFPFRGQGHKIVTLDEALGKFPDVRFNIDIKDQDLVAPRILADILRSHNREESVIVASFNNYVLERFREYAPEFVTSAHPGEIRKFVIGLRTRLLSLIVRSPAYAAFQVPIRYGNQTVVNERFVRDAHKRNIAVHVWTINDKETMEWLFELGVDGIFTDTPNLLKDVIKEHYHR